MRKSWQMASKLGANRFSPPATEGATNMEPFTWETLNSDGVLQALSIHMTPINKPPYLS
jgi:hypothetical protein